MAAAARGGLATPKQNGFRALPAAHNIGNVMDVRLCGINFFSSVRPEQKSAEQYYDEALRLSVLADELGYSHVRTVEHYFRPYGGLTPSPVIFLTMVAARTRRVRVVTGAVLPIFNHPIKLAGELAMLDNISHGRLTAGFARAFLPEEFDAFQRNMDESRARFEGGIAAVRRLWTETDVVYQDAFYRFGPVTSSPRPLQQPHPPIFVAAIGNPQSFAWTAEQGFGLMVVPYLSEFGALRANLRLYRETFAARHPDRPLPPVQMSFHLHVAETDAQAVAEASEPMQQYISVFRESAAAWEGRSSVAYPGYQQLITELDSMNIERVLREGRGFIGSPSSVERQVREAVDLFGDIEPSLSVLWGHMPYHQAEHSLRLFAAEVMPRLSEATAIAAPRIGT
jgi:alkanesulfonate monooxygenase SsuD/methylene tetrahydromethanopterin reductase-like flavin-dependent oxidoreductase (luciferase family)